MFVLDSIYTWTKYGLVFPLSKKSKKPMSGWKWQTMCTDDPDIINDWVNEYPNSNWGLVATKALIVDVDCKHGHDGFGSAIAYGGLTDTLRVSTPSGGYHYYYSLPSDEYRVTRNNLLDGIDIRCGFGGYVVVPGSIVINGTYQLDNRIPSESPSGTLSSVPSWVLDKLSHFSYLSSSPCTCTQNVTAETNQEPEIGNAVGSDPKDHNIPTALDMSLEYAEIKKRTRYLFFRRQANRQLFQRRSTTIRDQSDSAYLYGLTKGMYAVGGNDYECLAMARWWTSKHNLKFDVKRYIERIMPDAKRDIQPWIDEWKAKQPVRRKHGTTSDAILDAIKNGIKTPKEIAEYTNLKGSTVRMHLKRMVDSGKLIRIESYEIA